VVGSTRAASQIGHITVDEQGRICRCGNRGCLETLVGGASLLDLLPSGWTTQQPDLHALVEAAARGDLGCRRIVADAGRAVGAAAAMLCNVLHPRRLIVGGELAEATDLLLNPLRETLQRQTLPQAAAMVEVLPAQLGHRATALGAVVVVDRRFAVTADVPTLDATD
jgi:predicted NBD/HSP70 family sugar kinase